ncbi:unnamed protein product [Merluccius merluccius]
MERPGPVQTPIMVGTTANGTAAAAASANETFGADASPATHGDAAATGLVYQVTLAAVLSAITLVTTLSNAFVVAVISRSRKLRTPANFLIASLATTDLLVSVLVMPICVLYTVTHAWSLGQTVCDLWLSSDITCCTASILHLCVIALDRYWAVTDAVEYSKRRTPTRAAAMVATAWVIAVSISLPPLFWRRVKKAAEAEDVEVEEVTSCSVNTDHVFYTVYSTLGAFYIPTLLLIALYGRIYVEARKIILKQSPKKAAVTSGATSGSDATSGGGASGGAGGKRLTSAHLVNTSPGSAGSTTTTTSSGGSSLGPGGEGLVRVTVLADALLEKKRISAARERKATKTLGIILGAYIVCWLPFFIYTLVVATCDTCFYPELFDFFNWLGYFNSLVNPVIYTMSNEDFKKAFHKLVRFRCCRAR